MNSAEVLKQIVPCDMQKPFIFVSYSSQDKDLVWRDVLEFQRHGYNVWLDERNLDKTKASWKEDALAAIEDICCSLVVFYVSESSLISEACYREMAKTTDELTVALHYGPVKFIAVDVAEVGNIGEFTQNLYQSVVGSTELSKETKSKMVLTLHYFKKHFFDNNNERVRVHPKSEPNRKMNYYEEIMATFPDTTRVFENVAEKEAARTAEIEAQKEAEKEAAKAAAERAREAAEKREREAAKAEAPTAEIPKAEAQTAEIPAEETSDPSASITRERILQGLRLANEKPYVPFGFAEAKNEKKIQNAVNTYAKWVTPSEVLGILDTTVFGSGKSGFLITEKDLICYYFENKTRICLAAVKSAVCSKETGSSAYMTVSYKDGTEIRIGAGSYSRQLAAVLNYISGWGEEQTETVLHEEAEPEEEANPTTEAAEQKVKTVKTETKAAESKPKRGKNIDYTREQILCAIAAANEKASDTTKILRVVQTTEKKIKNALSVYAKGASYPDVLGFMDFTILGSGKEGILITQKALYSNRLKDKKPIEYRKLRAVRAAEDNSHFITVYEDGTEATHFMGSVYRAVVLAFLEGVLEEMQKAEISS